MHTYKIVTNSELLLWFNTAVVDEHECWTGKMLSRKRNVTCTFQLLIGVWNKKLSLWRWDWRSLTHLLFKHTSRFKAISFLHFFCQFLFPLLYANLLNLSYYKSSKHSAHVNKHCVIWVRYAVYRNIQEYVCKWTDPIILQKQQT